MPTFNQLASPLFAALLSLVAYAASAYEEPSHEVIYKNDVLEVRQYAPYLVSETVVTGSLEAARNEGGSNVCSDTFQVLISRAKKSV